MNRYVNLIHKNPDIKDFKIKQVKSHSYQLFYVGDKLETARVCDSEKYIISIYVDVNDKRGTADIAAYSYQKDDEIISNLIEAVSNAKLALNPYYSLPNPSKDKQVELPTNLSERPFKDIAGDIASTIFEATKESKAYSAATEIFLYKDEIRIINSNGIDVKETKYYGEIELIPTYDTKEKEVEIYHPISFSSFDQKALYEEVKEVLLLVEARYNAVELKNIKDIPVIINTPDVATFFDYYIEDASYSVAFQKMSLFNIGQNVQEKGNGTKLNLTMAPYYLGASESSSFDSDGVILKPTKIYQDGTLINRYGPNQFAQYLKAPCNGNLPVCIVEPGEVSISEMKKTPYLRVMRFSSTQVERFSGLFGGEVRLGFYFDGTKEIPVTGFTVTTNLNEVRGNIVFSKEETTSSNYHGPKYLLIKGMQIN